VLQDVAALVVDEVGVVVGGLDNIELRPYSCGPSLQVFMLMSFSILKLFTSMNSAGEKRYCETFNFALVCRKNSSNFISFLDIFMLYWYAAAGNVVLRSYAQGLDLPLEHQDTACRPVNMGQYKPFRDGRSIISNSMKQRYLKALQNIFKRQFLMH
jgi:hypothetical protein